MFELEIVKKENAKLKADLDRMKGVDEDYYLLLDLSFLLKCYYLL